MFQFFIGRSGGAAQTAKPAVATATATVIAPVPDAGAIVADLEIATATALVEPPSLVAATEVATAGAATATAMAVSPFEGPFGALLARLAAQPAHSIDDFDAEPACTALMGMN